MASLGSKTDSKRGRLLTLVVGESPDARAAVRQTLEEIGEPAVEVKEAGFGPAASEDAGDETPPEAVVVIFGSDDDAALNYLEMRATRQPRATLLALLATRTPGLIRRALRAGADEVLYSPLDAGAATNALLKVSEARARDSRVGNGTVISLTSVVGGTGVTSLAANLGISMQRNFGKRVALVDLDFQAGGLAVFLNLEPEMTIMPLVRLDRKLDSTQLESALTKHPSGLYLLSAPKRIDEGEMVTDSTVTTVLTLMRQLFDYVIVDCGDHLDELSVAAWESSEHLIYVLAQSVASARCAWRFIDLYDRLQLKSLQPRYVLNRFRAAHPLSVKQIESTLANSIFATIPEDSAAFERAELKATDIFDLAKGSAVTQAVDALAGGMMPTEATSQTEVAKGGMLGRLRAAFVSRS